MFSLLNQFVIIISLLTVMGVVLHDSKIDKAVSTMSYVSSFSKSNDGVKKSDFHTHVERFSTMHINHDTQSASPKIKPRNDGRKQVKPKNSVGGLNFGGYSATAI